TGESPLVDVRPGTVGHPLFVDEAERIVAALCPGHPPLAVDSDHGQQAGEYDLIADPAFGRAQDAVGSADQKVNPLFAEGIEGDVWSFASVGTDRADPIILFAKRKSTGTNVGVGRTETRGRNFILVMPFSGEPAEFLHLGSAGGGKASEGSLVEDA